MTYSATAISEGGAVALEPQIALSATFSATVVAHQDRHSSGHLHGIRHGEHRYGRTGRIPVRPTVPAGRRPVTIKTDWLPGDVFTSGDLNDLTVEVQSKLDASDAGGVDTDMLADDAVTSAKVSAAIRTSLGKADSAVQPADLSSAIADLSGVAVNAQTANYTLVLADASRRSKSPAPHRPR